MGGFGIYAALPHCCWAVLTAFRPSPLLAPLPPSVSDFLLL
jgi:hypothetical protein